MAHTKVRGVKIRLLGHAEDLQEITEFLAMLPALSQGRVQLGDISEPYPNRRGGGVRLYADAYVLDDTATTTAAAGPPATSPALPDAG